ncbi:hypothetical protein [Paenibacillus macerans]|uniref:hypothetical protein n=1 Tax=Paenibacillus macerans TaxID=44252 RepID=UPI003D3165D3
MGISFSSEFLEVKVRALLEFCEKYNIDVDFFDIDEDYEKEILINDETEITISLPATNEYQEPITIKKLLTLIDSAQNGRIENESLFYSPNLVLIPVSCVDPRINDSKLLDYYIEQKWDEKKIKVNFAKELTSYGIRLTMDNHFDKYVPPLSMDDLFIEISSLDTIDPRIVDDICQAFIFECASSLDINIFMTSRPTNLYYWDDEEKLPNIRLRPLMQGKGMSDLLRLYNSANQVHDAEYRILTYTKVIEYVSQTVLRKEMLESITNKLYSPKTLNPDANFILELEKLFAEHRNNQRDNQAIKLTVGTCCDIIDIAPVAPTYLKSIKKINIDSSKSDRSSCLDELASAISDTRNMLAHAKTNYQLKGKECPPDQLYEFANCLKIVANQTIRWFFRQHEDSRIV